jgi:DNA-directed RNA polymerase specialized sigma24 family protein
MRVDKTDILYENLTDEVQNGIRSRALYLSNKYPILDYQDLVQDGYLLVLELTRTHGRCPQAFIMKAINNMFSTKSRKASFYIARNQQLSACKDDSAYMDEETPKQIENTSLNCAMADKSPKQYVAVALSSKYGISKSKTCRITGEVNDRKSRKQSR